MGSVFSQHALHITGIVCERCTSVSSSAWRHSRGGVEARLIYGSPFTAERIVWKISRLHKNCLKNEICDYILFISGSRQHGTWERPKQRRRDGVMVQCAAASAAVHRLPDYRPHSFHKQTAYYI